MMIDNPAAWLGMVILMVLVLRGLFKAWTATKPASFWEKRDLGCVSSAKRNLDWGNANRKRSF
jgi:hypothetical protein